MNLLWEEHFEENNLKECLKKMNLPHLFICFLEGPLGAGKTTLLKHLHSEVQSPSYDLCHEHHSFYHLDLYRLKNIHELSSFGFEEMPSKSLFIEWGLSYKDFFKENFPNMPQYLMKVSRERLYSFYKVD